MQTHRTYSKTDKTTDIPVEIQHVKIANKNILIRTTIKASSKPCKILSLSFISPEG